MRHHLRAALCAGIAAATIAIGASGAGCSSTSAAPIAESSDAQVCPATLAETIGAACTLFGSICAPTIPCGFVQISISCTCNGSAYQCADGAGKSIDSADAASCLPAVDASSTCPLTELAAETAACQSPGLLCAYPSSCPSMFDQCECFPGETRDGGFGLRFECQASGCLSSDGGSSPSAEAEAGQPGDAAESSIDAASAPQGDSSTTDAASSSSDSSVGADQGSADGASSDAQASGGDGQPD